MEQADLTLHRCARRFLARNHCPLRGIRLRYRGRLILVRVRYLLLRVDYAGGQVLEAGDDPILGDVVLHGLPPLANDDLNLPRHPRWRGGPRR